MRVARRQAAVSAVLWTSCTAALSVVLAGVRIALARQQMLAVLLGQMDSSKRPWFVVFSLGRIVVTQLFTSSVLMLALFSLLVAALFGRPKIPQRWLVALTASLLLLTALAVYVTSRGFDWSSPCSAGEDRSVCLFGRASLSVSQLQLATLGVLGAGALGWVIAVLAAVRAARQGIVSDRRLSLVSTVVVGYFSGAWIDTYEYLHTQGEDDPLTDDETRGTYLENAAEFCLESSCYWTPEVHVVDYEHVDAGQRKYIEEDVAYWRTRRTEDIADMPKVGIPKCRREWLTKALLAGE